MLKATVNIEEIGKEVIQFLSQYIVVDKLILFGSYAKGLFREDSDFDFAVISRNFKGMKILEKIELFSKAALAVDSRVELKGFSDEDYLNPAHGTLLEVIKKEGKVIYP